VSSSGRPEPSTPERPWSVRYVSGLVRGWIERLGQVWVEGQIVQISRRPGAKLVFAVLRDTEADVSLPLTFWAAAFDQMGPVEEGARVVVAGKPRFWTGRGAFQLQVRELRRTGVGDLLARIEQVKRKLAAEGLFAPERKRPLPFIPSVVGLICGREAKAEDDVVVNARSRWPATRFRIVDVAVQGPTAPAQVTAALQELDGDPEVDVIVIARGGGAVEDLLGFSDEGLLRAVAAARTPVVSAIGHQADSPLLDLVADVRASTPTDAGKLIVPDLQAEAAGLAGAVERLRRGVARRVEAEAARLEALRSRPVLADPSWLWVSREGEVRSLRHDGRIALGRRLDRAAAEAATLAAKVEALSPAATLKRGYAVVTESGGAVVRSAGQVADGQAVRVRLADGAFRAERRG
jgi:exodeoxyribonuclease VII large subunit